MKFNNKEVLELLNLDVNIFGDKSNQEIVDFLREHSPFANSNPIHPFGSSKQTNETEKMTGKQVTRKVQEELRSRLLSP